MTMTNNPTIDGVSRELLANAANYMEGSASAQVNIWCRELRALLDAPVVERQPVEDTVQMASMPVERCYDVRAKMIIAFNQAKQAGADLDDQLDAAYRAALRFSPAPQDFADQQSTIAQLKAENERSETHRNDLLDKIIEQKTKIGSLNSEIERLKSVPVSTVLPKRQSLEKSFECGGFAQEHFSMGWNACLDATAALNKSP